MQKEVKNINCHLRELLKNVALDMRVPYKGVGTDGLVIEGFCVGLTCERSLVQSTFSIYICC